MRIYVAKDYHDMSRKAANIVSAQVIMKPNCVLGLATGSTPEGIYAQLTDWYNKGDIDFSSVKSVNLDEYKGLPRESDQSYYYYMNEHFFKGINIRPENTHIPNGMEPDGEKECARYNRVIESVGGIDLQILGIGANGHIGFNEPGEAFEVDHAGEKDSARRQRGGQGGRDVRGALRADHAGGTRVDPPAPQRRDRCGGRRGARQNPTVKAPRRGDGGSR